MTTTEKASHAPLDIVSDLIAPTLTPRPKSTPGPWRLVDIRHQKNGHIRIFTDASGHYSRIAEVMHQSQECEANARLIAAAPEMLEALETLRKAVVSLVWEPMGETGDESDWFVCALCNARTRGSTGHTSDCPMSKAQAAIRKAKGE